MLKGFDHRLRERDIHYVHSASLAVEDGIVFMSEPSAARLEKCDRTSSVNDVDVTGLDS